MNSTDKLSLHFMTMLSVLFFTHAPLVSASSICPQRDNANVVGEARLYDGEDFLYCEYYIDDKSKSKTRVEYYDKNQQLIALKDVDYNGSEFAPSVRQTDYRHGELRIAERLANDQYRLRYLPPNSDPEAIDEVVIENKDNLVVDAGFDKAIRSEWSALINGKKKRFDFAAPPSLRTFTVVIQQNDKPCLEELSDKGESVCFVVKSSSAFLNWFIKPIELVYERETRRLMQFSGGVNIMSDQGKSQRAVISYHYR